MADKVCTKCGETKALSEFDHFRDKSRGKVRVRGHCKSCRRLKVSEYDSQNREKKKVYNKTYLLDFSILDQCFVMKDLKKVDKDSFIKQELSF